MKFSVVIPTCDRPDKLRECLRRVFEQAPVCEVIVTDDSRGEASREVAAGYPAARWIAGPRRGPAANRNNGAREARGEWIVFVDDDCLPEPGWLAAFDAVTAAADVLEGRTECPLADRFAFYEIVENIAGGACWSCNLAVRRDKFFELGGFDEDFTKACAEDMELAWRMRERGMRMIFVSGARVTHPPRPMQPRDLIRRTAAHRWILLYRLKTGLSPVLGTSRPRVMFDLVTREYLDTLRMILQLGRDRWRIKGRALEVLWRCASLAAFMPYYLYWELEWRARLKAGGGWKATSQKPPAR